MADRPRFKLEFGGSVERKAGQAAIDPSTFRDLRNVNLFAGRMGVRKGLTRTQVLTFGDRIIAEHPLRGRAKLAVVSWNSTSGQAALWICDHDGTNPVQITGALLDAAFAGDPQPRIIMADLYDRLFIAHDEPLYWRRSTTKIFSFTTNTITDIFDTGFTDENGDEISPKFRGVKRHLNYLVGWGWGTADDGDRGEVLRISGPGEPTVFDMRHYFLVGARGEPIIMCDPAADILLVKKSTDTFRLNGYDRQTFGITPADPQFGQIVSKLSVTVGGVNYFWSHVGARRSGGAESVDLAVPLDLGGPPPDALVTSIDAETAFACYDPDEREVIFCFGQWAYVLHLAEEPTLKWSFRKYAIALYAGTISFSQAVANMEGAPTGTAIVFTGITPDGFSAAGPDYLEWWLETVGTFGPWDMIEFWVKENGGAWERGNLVEAERAYSRQVRITGLQAGWTYDFAMRIVRSALPNALYTNVDPSLWPAASVVVGNVNAETVLSIAEEDFSGELVPFPPGYVWRDAATYGTPEDMLVLPVVGLPNDSDEKVVWEAEVSDGVGGWIPVTAYVVTNGLSAYINSTDDHDAVNLEVTAFAGLTRDVRIRRTTALVVPITSWLDFLGVVFA